MALIWIETGITISVRKEHRLSEFYGGPKAFSEPETKAFNKFMLQHRKEI
jgi:hypothetical protein